MTRRKERNDLFNDALCMVHHSFQPVLHDWCNKGHGICYPICGMVHIKEPLLLMKKKEWPMKAASFLSDYLSGPYNMPNTI